MGRVCTLTTGGYADGEKAWPLWAGCADFDAFSGSSEHLQGIAYRCLSLQAQVHTVPRTQLTSPIASQLRPGSWQDTGPVTRR